MAFIWTPHRFSGGTLALDVANSVILRHLPEKTIDRLADPTDRAAFPAAAAMLCAERDLAASLAASPCPELPQILPLREAIDRYFRTRVSGTDDPLLLADLLERAAAALRRGTSGGDIVSATARSALRLIADNGQDRMKICGHCGWLFLDRSKNRSRAWCDMSVCGNRAKASRHYAASRARRTGQKEAP